MIIRYIMDDNQIYLCCLTSSNLKRVSWLLHNDTLVTVNFYFMNYDEDNVCF